MSAKPMKVSQEQEPALNVVSPEVEAPFVLLRSETLMLDREAAIRKAEEHAHLPKSCTERPLDKNRVKMLAEIIRGKKLLPCCWATVLYEDVIYRMNGQHSSTAILEMKDHLPDRIAIHLDHYRADSADDMGKLFRQFDQRWSSRTKAEVSGAYQGLIRSLRTIDRDKVKLGIEGIGWHDRYFAGVPLATGDELYSLILRPMYQPFLQWLDHIVYEKTPELKRKEVVAAMYGTYLASESGAQEFWYPISRPNDLLDAHDSRKVLSDCLLEQLKKDAKKVPQAYLAAICAKAWAAFRTNKTITSLNWDPKKGLPELAE